MDQQPNTLDLPVLTGELDKPLSVQQVIQQSYLIHQVLKEVMVEGIHYGKIPGIEKPTLLQPGAEKICTTFRLAAKQEVEDLSDRDANFYRYRVTVSLHMIQGGHFVGAGVGECSTDEEKYQWEAAVNQRHYDSVPVADRRIKFKKSREGDEVLEIPQVRRNAADLANTALKIAVKRGLISAARGATAASDLLEVDLDDEVQADMARADQSEQADKKSAGKVFKKAEPETVLPFGDHKGKKLSEVPSGDLLGILNGLRTRMAKPDRNKGWDKANQKLMKAIEADLERRKAAETPPDSKPDSAPAQAAAPSQSDARPLMADEVWKESVTLMKEKFAKEYTTALSAYQKQVGASEVAQADRWAFLDHVSQLSSAEEQPNGKKKT